jgi:hypothetical protein
MGRAAKDVLRAERFAAYTGYSYFSNTGGNVLIKDGKRQEEPGDILVLMLPVLAMGALIGILALLMHSTGKW